MSSLVMFRDLETGHEIKVTLKGKLGNETFDASFDFGGVNPEELKGMDHFSLMAVLLSEIGEIE
jgi:hypothetical protein